MEKINLNTALTRLWKIRRFFLLNQEPEERFDDYVTRIEVTAREINGMGADITITDILKQATLVYGTMDHHEQTFETARIMIEQTKNVTFAQCMDIMRPSAERAEKNHTDEAPTQAKATRQSDEKNSGLKPCFSHEKYGSCGDARCRFLHTGPPGTKKCPICGGGHSPKYCDKNKGKKNAKNAKDKDRDTKDKDKDTDSAADIDKKVEEVAQNKFKKWKKAFMAGQSEQHMARKVIFEEETYPSTDEESHTANIGRVTTDTQSTEARSSKETETHEGHEQKQHAFWGLSSQKKENKKREEQPEKPQKKGNKKRAEKPKRGFSSFLTVLLGLLCFLVPSSPNPRNATLFVVALAVLIGGVTLASAEHIQGHHLANRNQTTEWNVTGWGYSTQIGVVHTAKIAHAGQKWDDRNLTDYKWSVDSACSSHICKDLDAFKPGTLKRKNSKIEIANGSYMSSGWQGQVELKITGSAGTKQTITLHNVLYVPAASSNLMSVGQLIKNNHRLLFDKEACQIRNKSTGSYITIQMEKHMFDVTSSSHRRKCKSCEQFQGH
jgi:hypothetical protein